ncbi:RNP-1 like RNA-binding protein [Penicillium angulare]|uniref:RNP-1 like RNA-binding protein n=1 Tax=Penicillium angulare TaxID=116970 RepID=A0A9W9EUZ5_9EURO|nr:RNP-1 like RNA-binding protein [Penicillium angulare]
MSAKLFIGGLACTTTGDGLSDAFSEFGNATDSIVLTDRETGRSRGFELVTFSTSKEATEALEALKEQDLDGRRIHVQFTTDRRG